MSDVRQPGFCSIAVPPSKRFSGYINILLMRESTPEDNNKLEWELNSISNEIYQRERRPGP